MISGIYVIYNIINDKCYVGQAVNKDKRWKNHKIGLRTGKHQNRHLLAAYNKYGIDAFIYVWVDTTINDIEVLKDCEQWWMDTLKPEYNKHPTAGRSPIGYKHSEATRDKLSKIRKGKKRPPEFSLKLSEIVKNRIVSEEAKENMRKAHLGKKQSAATKAKRSLKMMGNQFNKDRKHSPEEIEMRRKAVAHGKKKAKVIRNFVYQSQIYFWSKGLTTS